MKAKAKYKSGGVVMPRWFIPGYPLGVVTDTRLVVAETSNVGTKAKPEYRYRCVRDDGRQGSWWIDESALRAPGEPV